MNIPDITQWDENDLLQLPDEETDFYEYKSSKTEIKALKKKINIAASAFWNSGGGIFIIGIDDNGKIDGGIPDTFGRQSIRDWIDQVVALVEPLGKYEIKVITRTDEVSQILDEHAVVVIGFEESYVGPHMASDNKYYIRAGAHSNPASHFLIEAIRARRGLEKPLLVGLIRRHLRKSHTLELVILSGNDAPAFDIRLNFEPLPNTFQGYSGNRFPLKISAIDKLHPFLMEISFWGPNSSKDFSEKPVELQLEYKDIIGRTYAHNQLLELLEGIGPMRFGDEPIDELRKSVDKISTEMNWFRKNFDRLLEAVSNTEIDE